MLSSIIYDKIEGLKRLFTTLQPFGEKCNIFLEQLTTIEEYYKFTYVRHIGTYCDIHGSMEKYLDLSGTPLPLLLESSTCKRCITPMKVIESMKERLCYELENVEVINDALHRLHMYCVHIHRAVAQGRRT